MIRAVIPVLMVLALCARALAAAPPAPAAPPAATPQPPTRQAGPHTLSPDELHALERQAFDLMKAGQYSKAAGPLEKVYNAIPAAQRSRALVLNHSIVDVAGRQYGMRGVRDLLVYFQHHTEADEPATNVLAIALNITAQDAKVKAGPVWQAGYREWNRRNSELDVSRSGFHRWGTKWISDDEYNKLEAQRKKINDDIAQQIDVVDRAAWRVSALNEQYNNALNERDRMDFVNSYVDQARGFSTAQREAALRAANGPQSALALALQAQQQQQDADTLLSRQLAAWQATHDAGGDVLSAVGDLQAENGRLRRLTAERDAIRPQWPERADPFDPDATAPDAPPLGAAQEPASAPAPTKTPAATTQPAADPNSGAPRPSPFDKYTQPSNKR